MEESLENRVLSDQQRAQIKRLLDYDEAQELFTASESSASIAASFVMNDLTRSMESLRHLEQRCDADADCSVGGSVEC